MNKFTYEEGIEKLEEIVLSLEKGELPLEDSFKAFEEGVKIADSLKKILSDGDSRIRELTENGIKLYDAEENNA